MYRIFDPERFADVIERQPEILAARHLRRAQKPLEAARFFLRAGELANWANPTGDGRTCRSSSLSQPARRPIRQSLKAPRRGGVVSGEPAALRRLVAACRPR